MVELFESLGFQINDRTPELPNCPHISLQPQYAGLPTSISQDRHPSVPIMPTAPRTGPLIFPDFIPRATTSYGAENRPMSSAPEIYSVRPFTAPVSLSQMLPPKRVLPFPPKHKKSGASNSEMNLSSSLSDPSEVAENPVTTDWNEAFTAAASGTNVLPPKAPTTNAANSQTSVQPTEVISILPDAEMIDVPSTPEIPPTVPQSRLTTTVSVKSAAQPWRKPPARPKKVIEPPAIPESMNAINLQKSGQASGSTSVLPDAKMIDVPSTSEILAMVPQSNSTTTVPATKAAKPRRKPPAKPKKVIEPLANLESPLSPSKTPRQARNVFEEVDPAEFMARLDGWVREYQHLPAPRPLEATSETLTAYAAQSNEERMMIIDDMICDCLGDENFVKLVEDVGESWKRIGLGL